ncbi:MAG: pyridoxal-dependent decarboxylase [Ilumatobacter sp.]|uniref:pyridoxal phosphate-dependent decarboxylase family protein n=1 Tax=Ilumatobacter sp. TaxID=1967498 RepID=UPI0026183E6A|nr:pyridoxal-dependent decarboxylase [Ilumatobacter sp.]MDJ0770177.1 pyridoxal-dependent decarboxylase [Ilumatobacter sp.]
MNPDQDLLGHAAARAIAYTATIDGRGVAASAPAVDGLAAFDEPLPDRPGDPTETLDLLATVGGPATVATTGPHYFGFVNGATYPVALGAAFIADAWDQNAALPVMSPAAAKLHDVAAAWLNEVLGLPTATDVAFLSGATVANATCLAAARDALLIDAGWDVQRDGLFGAPEIQVVVGERAHSTLGKSLGLIGVGRERVLVVPADDQGRMRAELLPDLDPGAGPILACAQAGEVNTGAFDPFADIADWASERAAWLHVDGAFGLWALADPTRQHLVTGLRRADSLATDAHKWLNVTYDSGIAFVQREGALRRTFASVAGYLPPEHGFEAMHHTPQSSQRARQIEVWAVLRTLGRSGVAAMVQQSSDAARVIGARLTEAGVDVLNDVDLNQVLVRHVDGPTTERLIAAVQEDGRIWCGPTQWHDETAMRVSVSSWKTTVHDAERAAAVIVELAHHL